MAPSARVIAPSPRLAEIEGHSGPRAGGFRVRGNRPTLGMRHGLSESVPLPGTGLCYPMDG
eukprot:scaffold1770_cov375-Prasinococcus_capsulatus_cf.AAC.9